jgi:Ca2+-binding RTX toxin-like protein
MDLNVLVRGQSNAIFLMTTNGGAAGPALVQEVKRLLGFDGVNDRVNLIYEDGGTAFGGTSLIGDWHRPFGGDWRQGWQTGPLGQALLDEVGALAAARRDDPTAVLWLHNEFDGTRDDLTTAEWVSAVRHDAAAVRAAFGQGAATVPYLFISAMPYVYDANFRSSDIGNQAIRRGMELLAAEPGFNADIAARMTDTDIDGDLPGAYGGGHIDGEDSLQTALRSARAIAESFAEYAKPGSPVALAGGDIADEGPQVVAATRIGANQLRLDVAHDGAAGFAALDPDAAAGIGWSLRGDGLVMAATSVSIVDADSLLVTFAGPIPPEALLFYGYGYGRLVGADGTGRGNAVYDDTGLPVWVAAEGLALPSPAVPGRVLAGDGRPDTLRGSGRADSLSGEGGDDALLGAKGDDTLRGGAGNDDLRGGDGADLLTGGEGDDRLQGDAGDDLLVTGSGADTVVWGTGAGDDRVTDFAIGADRLLLRGAATAEVTATLATQGGASGLLLGLADGSSLFLEGVGPVSAAELGLRGRFDVAAPPGQAVTGTRGADSLAGGNGPDTLRGGAGEDDLRGGAGNDVLRGGRDHDGLTGGTGVDSFAFARGDGVDWVVDFVPGLETIRLEGIAPAEVAQSVTTLFQYTGLLLEFGGDTVFLQGVTAPLAARDIVFA